MAKTYLDIQNSAYTVGNIMDWTNALTRLSGVPVDITEVYDSYDKAVEYAATNPVAYEGQLITVTENGDTTVYVITPAIQGTHKVTVGEETTTYNVNIKKVGTVPSGDNASITVTDAGLVSIFGFAGAENGMLPVREDGKLVWKTLEAIGAGDGNDNTTYNFALTESKTGIVVTPYFNGQPIMEGEEGAQTQKKFELVLDVYTKGEADDKFLAKADYTPYDDTSLVNRVSTVEATINGVEASEGVEAVEGLVDKVAANAQAIADETSARETAIENITKAETGAIAVAVAAEAEARDEAIKVVDDKIGEVAEGSTVVDMISAVEAKIPTVPTDVSAFNNDAGYLVAADIADKADKADTLAGYGIGDAYTKTEVDTAIDNATKSILGEGVEEAYNTLKEIQDILQGTDGEAIDGLVETVDANKNAIATLNGDVNTAGSVDKKIADAVAPLATTEALNGVKATAEAAQTAEQVESAIESAITEANLGQYAVKTEVETALADKADADSVVANSTFEQFKSDNADAIAAARTGAVEDVAKVGYALETTVAGTYATKNELSQHAADMEATLESTLTDYATIEAVNTELAKKIESATVALANETTSQGATVTGTTLNIVVDAYSRADTAKLIADSIKDIAGEDSIPAVKADLEAEITRSTNKDTAHDNAITALQTAVVEAKTQADKGVADAKTANDAIAALTTGVVATNTSDITVIKGRLDTLESAKGNHDQRITTVEGKVAALEAADIVINGTLTDLGNEIAGLKTADENLLKAINANTAKFDGYYTKSEVDTKVQEAIDAIPDVDFTGYATETFVTEAITVVNAKIATKANAAEVYTKTEADAKFMTETQVKAAMDKVVADVSDQDTIEGLVTLVEYVHDNAGDIAKLVSDVENNGKAINANVTAIAANKAAHEQNASDIVTLTATVAAQKVVESAEVSTTAADDGIQLGIKEVNVNKLVQTTGDILILNGGTAQA